MPVISLIVAMARGSRVIGLNGAIPWKLRKDLQRFKELTLNHPIIMGRKTFESIGQPLPGRKNIVMTRNKDFNAEGCIVVDSLDAALEEALKEEKNEIFVIGGEEIYKEALSLAERVYLTEVGYEGEGDAFFPELDPAVWSFSVLSQIDVDEHNQYPSAFINYERTIYNEL